MNANGRVNILKVPDINVFKLYDKIPVNEMVTSYRGALTGNFESTNLSKAYFSAENITAVQYKIMNGVLNASKGIFKIGFQNEDTLKIIMRSIFLQHSSNLSTNIIEQINALNKLVTDYCIPQICGEAEAYIKYKNDVSTLAVPITRPVSTYKNNTLETTNFF
tara:strand:- start:32 stop:520 length:489 start_codon:yes stop_codon:yes gene_type:complete